MIIAFTISSLMAIIIGVLAGCYGLFKAIVEPLVDFIRYMPVVAFVPLPSCGQALMIYRNF
jgi:NitT/TauT family transport system permease protein